MTASLQEVQQRADALLEILGVRVIAGQIVLHVSESRVQKVEANSVYRLPQKKVDIADE